MATIHGGCGESHEVTTYKDSDYVFDFRECMRCRPYVIEMYKIDPYGSLEDYGGIEAADFRLFMTEHHPDVLAEWEEDH